MEKLHLFRGSWITENKLEENLKKLPDILKKDLSIKLQPEILLEAAHKLSSKITSGKVPELFDSLIKNGNSSKQANETLKIIERFLSKDYLLKKFRRELGSTDPFTLKRVNFKDDVFEAWAPLGVLLHIVAGNAPTVAPLSVLEGLMSGNINLLKNSSKNGNFPQLLLKALADEDESNTLKKFIYAFQISSKHKNLLSYLYSHANGIAAWGGEESINSIKNEAPENVRIIEWGHKISFSYLASSQKDNKEILKKIAWDICIIEQQACSSPQCLYLETNNKNELIRFADNFAKTLNKVSQTIEPKKPELQEAAEISTVSSLVKTGEALQESKLIEADDHSWRILVDFKSGLRPSPLYRTIWIKAMPANKIVETLEPLRTYLQTAGLYCSVNELANFSEALLQSGVTRIMSPGKMLEDYSGQPHDGVYALQRYCRRVSLNIPDLTNSISDFTELIKVDEPLHLTDNHVTTKEDFLNQKIHFENKELFFKSGGTSGKPKKAVYTYDDYHIQMKAGAEALFAAGLNPKTDVCANLFYAGSMYGGFISFWSILEYLEAKQYPITAIPDLDEVADLIIDNNVNTLLGMPFYLSQLFDQCFDKFKNYTGLKKIFYGGEHWTKDQYSKYKDAFGIQTVKSAIYGSNDAGPLAYSCEHCSGSIHHVLTQTQYLEILKLDKDEKVDTGETGRLIFTSKYRKGQNLTRYEIGDLGRWVDEECLCGRKSPRFELLGRFGDIFKMGPLLNYHEFVLALENELGYTGSLQLVLDTTKNDKQQITLSMNDTVKYEIEKVRNSLYSAIHTLNHLSKEDNLIEIKVKYLPENSFKKSENSGKLIPIIDLRK